MMEVKLADAEDRLEELIAEAVAGEEIVITSATGSAVRLVALPQEEGVEPASYAMVIGHPLVDGLLPPAVALRAAFTGVTAEARGLRRAGSGAVGRARARRPGRLFHPFHRSAEQATGEALGVGLGLALSLRLARDFGGDLRAVDPVDGGAAFELALPLAP